MRPRSASLLERLSRTLPTMELFRRLRRSTPYLVRARRARTPFALLYARMPWPLQRAQPDGPDGNPPCGQTRTTRYVTDELAGGRSW